MKLNFVTLFNSSYLTRGLVLYESLLKHCPDFHLYVVAFDDVTYNYFQLNPHKNLTAISLSQFEDEKLLSVKSSRSSGEYCWTCTASTILYCINTYQLNHCVYIDADMCFYSNPQSLFDEWGDKSVLITEHRYTPEYDHCEESGIYCVQFVGFKNDVDGIKALKYWRESCIDWCYARVEDGKFGDQKYLDDWTTRFNNVHVLNHLGGGIAPWNIQQYEFKIDKKNVFGIEKRTGNKFELVFIHFHGLKFYDNNIVSIAPSEYELEKYLITLFFKPYVGLLMSQKSRIFKTDSSFNPNGSAGKAPYKRLNFRAIKEYYIEGIKNSRRNILGMYLIKKIKHHYFFNALDL